MVKSRSSRRLDLQLFLRYLTRIQGTFLDLPPGSGQTQPLIVLFLIAIIGITALISLGLLALVKRDTSVGIIDLTLASILIANLFHARRYRHYTFNIYLGIWLTGLLFVYLFVTGGVNRSGAFIWYYTFPLIASFVLGSKRGAVASALMLVPVIGLFLMRNPPPPFINYSFDFKVRFLSSFLVVFIFSYLFEYSREKNRDKLQRSYHDLEKRVEERTSALQKAIHSLQKEISERRQIEEALRQSEDRYRDVVESSHYLICTHDLQGQILSVNQEGARLLGYEQKDLLNKSVRDFLAPEFRDEFDTYLETVQKQGFAKGLMLLQTATGEKRVWEYNNTLRTEGVASPIVRAMAHDVTERIEAAKAVKRLSQENTIMAEIGQIISSTLNIEEVYDRFVEKVRNLIPFDRISINTINLEEQIATAAYSAGMNVPGRQKGSTFPLVGTLSRETARTRTGLLIQGENLQGIADRFPALSSSFQAGLRSTISVPLISKDQVIGVLIIQSAKPNAYTDLDLKLAERVGNQIAGAIANAQLFAERKRAEETVTRLSQEHAFVAKIGRIISSTLNINEVYEQFCEEVRKVIPFDRIVVTIIDHEKDVFYDEYVLGVDVLGRRLGDVVPLAGSLTEEVVRTQATQLVHIEDRAELAVRFPGLLPAFDAGLRSFMAVPLISKDQVVGTLHMFSLRSRVYTEADKNLVESIGNQIAGAIANARLFTERKNAEEAVRAEKQRFQILSDSAPFGIVVIDKAGTFKYINPKFREIFGYDLTDAPDGRTWFRKAFPDPTYRHRVISAWINDLGRFRPGEKTSKIFTVTCKDGTEKIANFTPVKLETGEYFMTCEDITDRKRAEEALRQSEERFRELFDHAPVGYHEFDIEGRITNVNLTDLEMLGYTQEEMLGHYIWEFSVDSETVRREVLEKLKGLRAPGQNIERVYRRKDGSILPVLIQDRLILDEQGKITGIRSIIQDITERKRAEEKLKESEERFRELAENIREVFYIAEQDTHQLSYVSPAYEEIWGRTCQSLYEDPKSFWDSIHPEDRNRVRESLTGKGQVEEVYRIVRPDGSTRWIKDRSFPIYNGSGKVQRIVGIAADITDLKLGEERMKYLSLHDPLTGLYNRIYFEEEMSRIEKTRYDSVGIVSCDVDGLKLVNDTLGHEQGDHLLVAAAKVIRQSFREGDLVARIGGDEFCVVLPNTTEADIEKACERIHEAVARYNADHRELPLSISIGSAVKKGAQENLKDLFREADNDMYRKKLYRTHDVRSTMFKTLINTLSARNLMTEKHAIRLEKLLASMADLLGLSESTTSDLFLLAKFHDIGEVAISDSILFKQGPLTSEEWTEIKRHCEIGYRIALSTPDLIPIAELILKHHEWWNGRGYPLGIKGEEIPIECRLFAIVDAYESMTSGRPYRTPFSHGQAVAELLNHSGKQFDPKLLRKFLNMLETPPPELGFNSPLQV
ncbi:MAG: PAS domain S-box protein [Syntrophaceae bacterium]|nr:PAS domain S-box protein [Syntrophaceae bacterium]